ncbi:hypothetical protein BJV82DRAFT_582745 [Fennellomyces sp. T-0311]|nr:hypothetical protein BJV82DRAFT_582745 [Fennellomyces sp. T-0311]
MASQLDKALDDVIKDNRRSHRAKPPQKPRRQPHQASSGGIRKRSGGFNGSGRPAASQIVRTVQLPRFSGGSRSGGRKDTSKQWTHDMFDDRDFGGRSSLASRLGARHGGSGGGRSDDGREIAIENLHYNVVEKDLQELFEMVGRVEKTRIIFDRSGRSTGTAKIKFARLADAEAAVAKYNNVELDGQAMRIELSTGHRGGRSGDSTGNGNSSGGRGRRNFRDRRGNDGGARKTRSATDLDQEMDAYMKSTDNGADDNQDMVID